MKNQQRWTQLWRPFIAATAIASGASQAATIIVNSLLDDVFPDASGAIFDVSGAPVTLTAAKCTLRMAIASANLDLAVGGANGCVAGDSETLITSPPRGVADVIRFSSAVTGTIDVNVTKKMSEAPAVFRDLTSGAPAPNTKSALVVTRPLVIQGNTASGVPTVTLDGGLLANSAADGRILSASDGNNATDTPFSLSNLAFQNARVVGAPGGCFMSNETVFLATLTFNNCISEGDATLSGVGGAIAIYTQGSGNTPAMRPGVRMQSVTVSNSKAIRGASTVASDSGGIAIGSGFSFAGYAGNVALSAVTVDNCEAENFGGASISFARNIDITHGIIRNNRASGPQSADSGYTGGIRIQNSSDINLNELQVLSNSANTGRGGIEIRNNARMNATALTVTGNSVANSLGTIYTADGGMRINAMTSVSGSRWNVSNNTLTGSVSAGGAIGGFSLTNVTGATVLRDILVTGNTCSNASDCAMLFSGNGSVDIQGLKSINNVATKVGSAYTGNAGFRAARNTSLRLADAEISGNVTPDFGIVDLTASFSDFTGDPAVAVSPLPVTTNSVLVENSTIYGNTAQARTLFITSPGIYTLRNITVANNNTSVICGGGIVANVFSPFSANNATQIKIANSTITRNSAGCGTALGVDAYAGSTTGQGPVNALVTVESSILGRQSLSSSNGVVYFSDPSKLTLIKTLVEDGGGSAAAQCNTNGNLCNTNPLLDVLALNGGPTPTMRLLPGSPALNVGSNPASLTTDQRGAARVVGAAADMGAFESPPIVAGSCNLDMDGDNLLNGNKEGLVLLRAMLGFTGAATTVGTGITAAQWTTARPLINTNCGTNFAP